MTGTDVADRATPAPPEPSRAESVQLRWRAVRASAALPVALAALAALVLGLVAGRATAPTVDESAVAVVARDVLPLVVDADAIWTAGTGDAPGVGAQLQELRLTGDPDAVAPHVSTWVDAYDTVLRRIVGVDVPAGARPVQRQLVAAVTLSRDAVEILGTAAEVGDPATRRELSSEALRLRIRAEQLTQAGQAAVHDLRGAATTGVSVPPSLPTLAELR